MTTATEPDRDAAPVEEEKPKTTLQRLLGAQAFQILGVLLILIVLFSLAEPDAFLSVNNFRNVVVNVSILAIIGVGMTFVIVTGGIDLSVGSVLVFSGVVAAKVMEALGGQGVGVSIVGALVACGAGTLWGLFNGVVVARLKVPPLIVTLGTLGMALGAAQILTGGIDLRGAPTVLTDTIGFGRLFGQIPYLSLIALAVVVVGAVVLHRTRFGRYTYAVGSNGEAARRVGVKADRHLILVYTLAGSCAGLAGILNLAFFSSTTIAGQSNTALNVIAGVVIGGTSLFGGIGTIAGTVIGLFIPAVLQNGFVIMGVQPFWQQVVVGAFLIAAVYVDQVRRAAASRGASARRSSFSRFSRPRGARRKEAQ
ncbi:ABC transporter permease [Geodermatophilus sp. DSM 44513]|uniref:ABC transporter permease n=1 Tax=Geodermatophilus sp. DSM 44513 TaxID=1528104 RepID=UPI00126B3DA2|nr:ABC transporter permease [Geodermatophilus sp. DSM 44513]WNV73862.1 ABC transporter permease [Geodermatophilus sp. DSM 44513]